MNVTPQRLAGKEASRVDELIDAASRLISLQGYDRTSVRDIAQAVNLTSGSMFYHFKTKDDLLEAVIRKGIIDGLAFMNQALDLAPGGTLNRFHALVAAHIGVVQGELRHFHRVWTREWDRLQPEARLRLRPLSEQYRELMNALLHSLAAEGHLHSDIETARHLLLPGLNWTPTWTSLKDKASQATLAEKICATVLNLPVDAFSELMHAETTTGPGHRRTID